MTIDIASYSELFKWDTCPRQWWYQFGLSLRPVVQSAAIDTGLKGHKLLQNFYTFLQNGESKEHALKLTQQSATALIRSHSVAEVGPLLKSWTLVDNFIRDTEFVNKAVIVENRFLIPITSIVPLAVAAAYGVEEVKIGFTPDVVFEKMGGFCEVEDAKFVGRAWTKSKINRFQQSKLYQIFLKRMGYNVSRSSIRFFNVTTGLIKVQNFILSEKEEETIIHDFLRAVSEVTAFKKLPLEVQQNARRTTNYTACQFCSFEFVCTLEAEGKDASKTLKAEFVRSTYDYSV